MTIVTFLGYKVSNRGAKADAQAAMAMLVSERNSRVVATINPHSTIVATKNKVFAKALAQADILLPDGFGVVWGGRFLGLPISERVTGFDFFQEFSALAQARGGLSCFFIGSSNDVLSKIAERMSVDYPAISVTGVLSPPFKAEFSEEENIKMCRAINAAKVDVLWVGMTAPKQEMWVQQNRHRLNVGFSASIGAVFDFYAGTKKRAPLWVQKIGCEWLYRFILEPKRMWGRYVINNPRFIWLLLKEKFKRS